MLNALRRIDTDLYILSTRRRMAVRYRLPTPIIRATFTSAILRAKMQIYIVLKQK